MAYFDDPQGRAAEDLAWEADLARKRGDHGRALALYRRAAEIETALAGAIPPTEARVRGVLAVTAVALWSDAEEPLRALAVAKEFLAGGGIAEEFVPEMGELITRNESVIESMRAQLDALRGQ